MAVSTVLWSLHIKNDWMLKDSGDRKGDNMIEKHGKGIWIECEEFSIRVKDIPFGKDAIHRYERIEKTLEWVKNNKVKCYLLAKIIKEGISEQEALSLVLEKEHLTDIIYKEVMYNGV